MRINVLKDRQDIRGFPILTASSEKAFFPQQNCD